MPRDIFNLERKKSVKMTQITVNMTYYHIMLVLLLIGAVIGTAGLVFHAVTGEAFAGTVEMMFPYMLILFGSLGCIAFLFKRTRWLGLLLIGGVIIAFGIGLAPIFWPMAASGVFGMSENIPLAVIPVIFMVGGGIIIFVAGYFIYTRRQ